MATTADARVAELASRQLGLVTRLQARMLGLSDHQLRHRIRHKGWTQVHGRVLRLPGAIVNSETELLAVLLEFPDAIASHHSAATRWRMHPVPDSADIHITRRHRWAHPLAGVHLHQSCHLPDRHIRVMGTTRLTSRARTLFDMAAVIPSDDSFALIDAQVAARQVSLEQLAALVGEHARPGRPGSVTMTRYLDDRLASGVPGSALESRFAALCAEYDLPMGIRQLNAPWRERPGAGASERVDVAYPWATLIVELDGRSFHGLLEGFDNDRKRDRLAAERGWTTARITWHQLTEDPAGVAQSIRRLLSIGSTRTERGKSIESESDDAA